MTPSKQTWLVVALALALVASLAGNWYLWSFIEGWGWLTASAQISTTEVNARYAMKLKRRFEAGDIEGAEKYVDILIEVQTSLLEILADSEESPESIRRAASRALASIEDGSILDVSQQPQHNP